jgi:hypothetical protein
MLSRTLLRQASLPYGLRGAEALVAVPRTGGRSLFTSEQLQGLVGKLQYPSAH